MNDIEYIIRVVLKARDDMRGKLGAAAAEIRGLDAAADGLDKRLDNVNKKVTSFNTRVNNLGATLKKVREGDATLDDVLKDITKSEQDLEHASKSATAALGDQHQAQQHKVKSSKDLASTTKDVADVEGVLAEAISKTGEQIRITDKDVRDLAAARGLDLKALEKAKDKQKEFADELEKQQNRMKKMRDKAGLARTGEINYDRLPDDVARDLQQQHAFIEGLKDAHAKAVANAEKAKIEQQTKLEQAAHELRLEMARREADVEAETTGAIHKSTQAREDDTDAVIAHTDAILSDIDAQEKAERQAAKPKKAAPRTRPKSEAKKEGEEDGEAYAEAFEEAKSRVFEPKTGGGRTGRRENEANADLERELDEAFRKSASEYDDFDQGSFSAGAFGLEGAAPNKRRDEERAKNLKRQTEAQEKALRQLRDDFQATRSAAAQFFREFKDGDIDAKSFLEHVKDLAREYNRFAQSASRLRAASDSRKFTENLRREAERLPLQAEVLTKAPVEERSQSKFLRTMLIDDADALRDRIKAFDDNEEAVSKSVVAEKEEKEAVEETTRVVRRSNSEHRRGRRDVYEYDKSLSALTNGFLRYAQNVNQSHESVAALDNRLRGLLLLAVLAFAQQFITVLVGLVGALGAVASSAVYAGAALGGAFVAGIAQALPMIGLLIASLARLKSIMDVSQQADLVDQQRFQRRAASQKKVADTTDAVANANDALKAAEDRVGDAHRAVTDKVEALTKAREDAREQLRSLIDTEQEAELAAKGAAISQGEAQDALVAAIASGDGESIASAELRVLETTRERKKAEEDLTKAQRERRRGEKQGVEGNEGVVRAHRDIGDARKAVDDAEGAVEKARRGVEKAKRGADAAGADAFAGAEKLNYLLKQLTPAERRLYDSIRNIRETYKKNFRPITDILISEFDRGVKTADRLLKDPRILGSAKDMATGIAHEMGAIRKSFTDDRSINQFTRIMAQGRRNLEPFGRMLRNFGHALLNLAEEAGPTLNRIVNWFADLSEEFLNTTENSKEMSKFFNRAGTDLLAWLDTLTDIVKLFMTLADIGESSGFSMIQDLGKWARDTREEVKGNREETAKFFEDSKETLYTVLRVLSALAKAVIEVFDADKIKSFADFLINTVIPAVVDAVKIMGSITSAFFRLFSGDIGGPIARFIITLMLLVKVGRSSVTAIGGLANAFGNLFRTLENRIPVLPGLIRRAFGGIGTYIGGLMTQLGAFLSRFKVTQRLGGLLTGKGIDVTEKAAAGATAGAAEGATEAAEVGAAIQSAFVTGATEAAAIIREALASGGAVVGAEARTGIVQGSTTGGLRMGTSITESSTVGAGEMGAAIEGASIPAARNLAAGAAAGGGVPLPGGKKGLLGRAGGFIMKAGKFVLPPAIAAYAGFEAGSAANKAAGFDPDNISNEASRRDGGFGLRRSAGALGQVWGALNRGFTDDTMKQVNEFGDKIHDLGDDIKKLPHGELKKLRDEAGSLRKQFYSGDLDDQEKKERAGFDKFITYADQALSKGREFVRFRKSMDVALRRNLRGGAGGDDKDLLDPKAVDQFLDNMKRIRQGGFRTGQALFDDFDYNLDKISKGFKVGSGSWAEAVESNMAVARKNLREGLRNGSIDTDRYTTLMARLGFKNMKLLRDNMSTLSKEGKEALGSNMIKAADAVRDQMERTHTVTKEGMQKVRTLLVRGLKTYGFTEEQAIHLSDPANKYKTLSGSRGNPGGAVGGWIGRAGERGRDMVNAVLGRGEYVLNWAKQKYLKQRYGVGMDELERIKGFHAGGPESQGGYGVYGYAQGGFTRIPSSWGQSNEEVASSLYPLLARLEKRFHFLVTDAYDRDHSAGHKSPGHNVFGTAVDLVPGRGGSWNMIEAMGRWAINKGYQVLYGSNGVGTPFAGHGRGLHMHIEFPHGGAPASAAAPLAKLKQINPFGVFQGGLAGANAAAAINLNREVANKLLRDAYASYFDTQTAAAAGTSGGPFIDVSAKGSVPQILLRTWRAMNMPFKALLSAFETGIVESGMKNLSGGDADSAGWRQERRSLYRDPTNVPHSAQRYFREWGQYNRAGLTAGQVAANVQRPAAQYRGRYDEARARAISLLRQMGIRIPAAAARYAMGGYATGGEIPGYGGGDRYPILTEGGEHVFTKEEVANAGGHSVMYALRQMLGGGGQGGPEGYARGGRILDIGDSLSDTKEFERALSRAFKGAVVSVTKGGRNSLWGLDRLGENLKKSIRTVVWDLGTNDGTTGLFERSLRKAYRKVHAAGADFVIPTISGTKGNVGKQEKNEFIRDFAKKHSDVTVVAINKMVGAGRLKTSDEYGHVFGEEAKKRARIIAGGINAARSGGETIGRRDQDGLTGDNARAQARLNALFSTAYEKARLARIREGVYSLPTLPLRSWQDVVREGKRAMSALNNVGSAWRLRMRDLADELAELEKGGVTKKERGRRQQIISDISDLALGRHGARHDATVAAKGMTLENITKDGGIIDQMAAAREKMADSLQTGLAMAKYKLDGIAKKGKKWQVDLRRNPAQEADHALDEARKELQATLSDKDFIERTRKTIVARLKKLKRGGIKPGESPEVRRLEHQLSGIDEDLQTIQSTTAQKIAAVYEAQVAAQGARIDKINAKAETGQARVGIIKRLNEQVQNPQVAKGISVLTKALLTNQADALDKEIARAKAMKNTELAEQLTTQVMELRASIWELAQQDVRDAAESINTTADRKLGNLDRADRMLNALGAVGLGGVTERLGGLTRADVFRQRGEAMGTQRDELQALLDRTKADPVTAINQKLIDELTDKIADLDATIAENNRLTFDARVSAVNEQASRLSGNIDLNKQILTLQGAISGTTDNAGLLTLETQRKQILEDQRIGLQNLLDEAVKNHDDTAVNDLTTQLLQNQVATLENTQAINELNGVTNQPQTFSTSAWQWFREAIFTGMGDVLPQYIVPGAATGGIVTKSGLAMVHAGEPIVPAHIADGDWGKGGDHNEYHFHSVDGNIDMTEFTATVAWNKKTAP